MPRAEEWVERAAQAITSLLDEHHALVGPELEARIAERYFKTSPGNIDPHHVTTARNNLLQSNHIQEITGTTRGNRQVKTLQLTGVRLRKTAVSRAAARRRLLHGRYLGWASGTRRHPHGLIGPAGERAVRLALADCGAFQPAEPHFGETAFLLGHRLSGPVDSAAIRVPMLPGGGYGTPLTLLFEVKNLRSWIYPSSAELYQLLTKGLDLQTTRPSEAIVPVLVCRRASGTIYSMSKQLGFFVIEMDAQWVSGVEPAELDPLRVELYYHDLRVQTGPSVRVVDRMSKPTVLGALPPTSERWLSTTFDTAVAHQIRAIHATRNHASATKKRLAAVDVLRSILGHPGW